MSVVVLVAACLAAVVDVENRAALDTLSRSGRPVVLEFYAPWCGHCKEFEKHYRELDRTLGSNILFARADGDSLVDLADEWKVSGFPTVYFIPVGPIQYSRAVEYEGELTAPSVAAWLADIQPPTPKAASAKPAQLHAESALQSMLAMQQANVLCDLALVPTTGADDTVFAHAVVFSAASDSVRNQILAASAHDVGFVIETGVSPSALRHLVHFAYTGLVTCDADVIEAARKLEMAAVARSCLTPPVVPSAVSAKPYGVLVIGGSHLRSMEAYRTDTNRWRAVSHSLRATRMGFGAAVVGDALYIMGGFDENDEAVRDVDVLLVQNGQWDAGTPLPTAKAFFATVSVDGAIYVVGGTLSDGSSLASVQHFAQGKWVDDADMKMARVGCAAAAVGDTIYVFGGLDSSGYLVGLVEAYETKRSVWVPSPATMPHPRTTLQAAVVGGSVQLMGGLGTEFVSEGDTDTYDVATRLWSRSAPMATARSLHCSTVTPGGHVFVMGGTDERGTALNSVERWDGANWSARKGMGSAREGCVAVAVTLDMLHTLVGQ